MENWYDREQIFCVYCGHRWILTSNIEITDEQHYIWVENVLKQHAQIKEEKEE